MVPHLGEKYKARTKYYDIFALLSKLRLKGTVSKIKEDLWVMPLSEILFHLSEIHFHLRETGLHLRETRYHLRETQLHLSET